MSLEWNVMEAIITAWMHICNRQKVAKYVLERIKTHKNAKENLKP